MKILTSALIIGLATAIPLKEISGSYEYPNGIVDPGFAYSFELAYETSYDSDYSSNDDSIIYESYELNFNSEADLYFSVTLFNTYTYTADLSFTIFDITPYRQFIQWVNPIAVLQGSTFDIGLRGEYDIYFFDFVLEHSQTLKEFNIDVASWISDYFNGSATLSDLIPTSSDWSESDEVEFDSEIFEVDSLGWASSRPWYGT